MAGKTTTMVLNTVDLQCSTCYKKVKKVLCKFPGIRDQMYDEKNNQVTIRVLCCDPEKIRDKLCCEGRKVIKSIQIVEPEKKATEKTKDDKHNDPAPAPPVPVCGPVHGKKASDKKPDKKPEPKDPAPAPPVPVCGPVHGKKASDKKPDKKPEPKDPAPAPPVPVCGPVHGFPPMPMYPNGACCGSCAQGHGGGPCYEGYGRPVPPPPGACCGSCAQGHGGGPCYEGYGRPVPPPPGPCYDYGRPVPPPPGPCYNYGRPVYDYGYGYRGSKCCVSTDYFSEENSQGCTIM